MAEKVEGLPVKRFRPNEGPVLADIRFLRKGDIFWYDKKGKPTPLPAIYLTEADLKKKKKPLFYVAVGNPIWVKERTGGRTFLGIKYREATQEEIRAIAYSLTIDNPPSE